MISAVAARKAAAAALALAQAGSGRQDEFVEVATTSEDASIVKRKSSSTEPSGSPALRKRAKVKSVKPRETKQKKTPKKKAPLQRYFAAPGGHDSFQKGDDVIAIDFDSSSVSSGSLDHGLEDDDNMFSSSDGMSDSDDEESSTRHEDTMEVDVNLSTFFPNASSSSRQTISAPLSTFKPTPNENVFPLTADEISSLMLPPSASTSLTHSPLASTLVLLPPHESICIIGTCNITVLHGSVSLLGTPVYPSTHSHRVYAPKSSPLPVIRYSFSKGAENLSVLSNANLPGRITIDEEMKKHGAVLLFQELKTGVEGLGKICRPFLNTFKPSKWQSHGQLANPFSIPGLYMAYEQFSDIQPFTLPQSWSTAFDRCRSIVNAPDTQEMCNIYLVKGSKNVGKSTFARTLMNQLLNTYERVAFLECDLGQSEFTPGGMAALNIISRPIFGPPFTHPTLPIAAHYIGSSTPRSSPSHYLEAVQALLEIYKQEIQTPSDERLAREEHPNTDGRPPQRIRHIIPLIINTMGWTKGLGSDLTRNIEEWAIPTDIFTFESRVEESSTGLASLPIRHHRFGAFYAGLSAMEGDDGIISDPTNSRTYLLDSPPQQVGGSGGGGAFTAADHRTLSLLSYFHSVFPPLPHDLSPSSFSGAHHLPLARGLSLGQSTAESWNTSVPLVAMPPYEVDCSQALDRLVLAGSGSEDVVFSEVGRVLNGALVGLVSCDESAFSHWSSAHGGPQQEQRNRRLPYTQHCPLPSPSAATCIGIGLIRGVAPHLIEDEEDMEAPASTGEGRGDLQLLTPVPPAMLSTTRVFVKGEMELPVWGMLDFGAWDGEGAGKNANSGVVEMEQGKTPYLQWGKNVAGAVGAEKKKVRRNLMRRGQT